MGYMLPDLALETLLGSGLPHHGPELSLVQAK